MKPDDNPQPNPPQPAQRKVFDVSRPGRTPAPPNNRSVIVGHRPEVNPAVSVDGIAERQPLMDPRKKIEINPGQDAMPPAGTPQPNAPEQEAVAAVPATPPSAELASAPGLPPAVPAEPVPAAPEPQPAAMPAPPQSFPPQQPSVPPEVPAALGFAAAPEDKLLEGLAPPAVTEHQPVISQHMPHKKSAWKVIIVFLVILVLAAAALDVLLDAGFLEWNIPHTKFF